MKGTALRLPLLVVIPFLIGLGAVRPSSALDDPGPVRVGILAFEGQYEDWRAILQQFERESEPPLRFELALGVYSELLHWMEEGWIDVAVLSPSLFVLSQDPDRYPSAARTFEYLSTIGYRSPGAGADEPYRFHYRSLCVVPRDSKLHTVEDLHEAEASGDLLYLFGHPLSTSGRIVPEGALHRVGIEPGPDRIEYAQSHTNALRLLLQDDGGERVAFVYDDALELNPELAAQVRVIAFPELDELLLPWDVVVGRNDDPRVEAFEALLLRYRDATGAARFRRLEDHQERYAVVDRGVEEIDLAWDPQGGMEMSLEEIGSYLEHVRRTQPEPPRLAVVLSGGGAKCSYQVGAMAAVEEELERLNEENPGGGFGIDLVVGTSGGAINALPVALGLASTPEGMEDFKAVWTSLDQREIIRLAPLLRGSIGLWLAILRVTVLILLLKLFVRRRETRAWWLGGILVGVGVFEAVLRAPLQPSWEFLGNDHVKHHLWLWVSQGHPVSVAFLFVLGVLILAAQFLLHRRGRSLHLPRGQLVGLALFLLITLPLATGYYLLFGEETLSRGKGIEQAMADGMSLMVGNHVERVSGERIQFPGDTATERLQAVSRAIHDRSLLRRDLVVTASCLEQTGSLLPDDLYFFMRAGDAARSSPLGARGLALERFPDRLMEVIMGSGSIFPVFPARTLADFPEPGQTVKLVDGGFAHNSPVEAAVLWGATHIILIEASPRRTREGGAFAANVLAAVEHYARQVEQVDRRSSKEVVVFTLSPRAPHPCLLDFSDNLIRATIEKGYRDARGVREVGDATVPERRFVKQPGKPVFTPVS